MWLVFIVVNAYLQILQIFGRIAHGRIKELILNIDQIKVTTKVKFGILHHIQQVQSYLDRLLKYPLI